MGRAARAPDRAPRVDAPRAGARLAVRRQLDGDTEPILVRPQAAAVVRELGREHRRGQSRDVGREGTVCSATIERRSGRNIRRYIRDVHPGAEATVLLLDGERVVEVLRGLRVDGEGELLA